MAFEEQFYQYIKNNALLESGQSVLVAVSGGLDSTVLAHLLHATPGLAKVGICHCNFQLRAAESDGDEQFVRALAAELNAPFFVTSFNTNDYAATNGISTQMAARTLRYAWFAELCAREGYDLLATAHHLNDNVETTLLNLTRGTGIAGLTGMAHRVSRAEGPENAVVIRPLLWATRTEIHTYAQQNNIAWREDSSNLSDDYARNFIRHHVVPLLEDLNPNFLYTTERTMQRMRDMAANYAFMLQQIFTSGDETAAPATEYTIQKQMLLQFPAPGQVLLELLKKYGFDPEQARQLGEHLDHTGLELVSETGWRLLNDRQVLQLTHPDHLPALEQVWVEETDLMVKLPDGNTLFFMPSERPVVYPDGRDTIIIAADKLQFPLHLRPWQPGDVFQPFGMHGHSQKLQDYFTNEKISRLDKEKVWVLVNGDTAIIWVVGFRLDERFKIVESTHKFLKVNRIWR